MRMIAICLASLVFTACDIDVEAYVGPQTCELVEEFVAEDDPHWAPTDKDDCNGFKELKGECLEECFEAHDCSSDYYCRYELQECWPRTQAGSCKFDEQCVSNVCACEVCVDSEKLSKILAEGISVGAD